MKTYTFFEHNGNASITLSASSFEQAYEYLVKITKHPSDWRVEDEEGEEE